MLTTLTAQAYDYERTRQAPTLLEFVIRVVERIPTGISTFSSGGKWTFSVLNPVNNGENFAESWTFEKYSRFLTWHQKALAWLRSMAVSEGHGIDVLVTRMSEEFGKEPALNAAKAFASEMNRAQELGQTKVGKSGQIGAIGVPLSSTVFFGA